MIYIVKINNKEYEVEVERGQANILKTTAVIKPNVPAQIIASAPVSTLPPLVLSTGGEVIKSPMPGTIIDIKVGLGTIVKKGEVLVILEAMKMENELISSTDGVIAQILFVKGSAVVTGDILVVIQ